MHRPSLLKAALLVSLFSLLTGPLRGAVKIPVNPCVGRDAVYTMDNGTNGNQVLAFSRALDGALSPDGAHPTGGRGTGGGLGNQGAVLLARGGRFLFVCNAGSDDVSVFRVNDLSIELIHRIHSGGQRPISLTLHADVLYVLNAGGQVGGADSITGFLFDGLQLSPLPGSSRPLSAANTAPAQIGFSPDGRVLVVTERATSTINTYTLRGNGLVETHQRFVSRGPTPFGFAFRMEELLVSEAFGGAANASAVSSYELRSNGDLAAISPSVPTTETAACWLVVTRSGRHAYVSNNGSGSISGYRIGNGSVLTPLNADGVTGSTGPGSRPIDLALSHDSRHLYVLNAGDGTLGRFSFGPAGSLIPQAGLTGLPAGANGLAAR